MHRQTCSHDDAEIELQIAGIFSGVSEYFSESPKRISTRDSIDRRSLRLFRGVRKLNPIKNRPGNGIILKSHEQRIQVYRQTAPIADFWQLFAPSRNKDVPRISQDPKLIPFSVRTFRYHVRNLMSSLGRHVITAATVDRFIISPFGKPILRR